MCPNYGKELIIIHPYSGPTQCATDLVSDKRKYIQLPSSDDNDMRLLLLAINVSAATVPFPRPSLTNVAMPYLLRQSYTHGTPARSKHTSMLSATSVDN